MIRTACRAVPTRPKTVAQLLDSEVDQFDALLAEVRGGFRDQRHFDALEERARGLAARIIAAFRGSR